MKHKLLSKLANISRELHQNGICHRDYYLCHFLLPKNTQLNKTTGKGKAGKDFDLYLIDLHRALIKNTLGMRWVIKDISGLLYSALEIGLTQRDLYRFIKIYSGQNLRDALAHDGTFWGAVHKRAMAMYKKLGPAD